jgi:hypothetical protein
MHFMEPEVSWPYIKEPTSRPCPVPHESSQRFSHLICKTHVTLVLPSKPVFQVASFLNIVLLKFCMYVFLFFPSRVTCPAHLILLDFITLFIFNEEQKSCSTPLCNYLKFPRTSSLLLPNVFFSALFSNTIRLCSAISVTDQVWHPYTTTGKMYWLCMRVSYKETSKYQVSDTLQQWLNKDVGVNV